MLGGALGSEEGFDNDGGDELVDRIVEGAGDNDRADEKFGDKLG